MKKAIIRVNLPVLRAKRNRMTQAELAREAGISPRTVSRLETGETTGIEWDTLSAICVAMDCQPGDVLELVPAEQIQATKPKPANGRRKKVGGA